LSHRRALDHVLALVVGAECGADLILRGSLAGRGASGDRVSNG
jgi:hypothetical protein